MYYLCLQMAEFNISQILNWPRDWVGSVGSHVAHVSLAWLNPNSPLFAVVACLK